MSNKNQIDKMADAMVENLGPRIFGYPTIEEYKNKKLSPEHEEALSRSEIRAWKEMKGVEDE